MPVRAIREQIVAALDVVVQIARVPDGRRRITHISEIIDIDPETQRIVTEDIFVLRAIYGEESQDAQLRHTGYIPSFAESLIRNEFLGVEAFT
jgi:pilus assembly protein CpaF